MDKLKSVHLSLPIWRVVKQIALDYDMEVRTVVAAAVELYATKMLPKRGPK